MDRLVMCFIDEAWAYMNPKLAEFTSVSRQAKCCTLALHQSLGQIIDPNQRQVMLGNFRTPIILAINDKLSLQEFETVFGKHTVLRESRSESSGFSGVERQLLTDSLSARLGGESKSLSVSQSEVDVPRFSMDEILHLPRNRAVVQMYDGDNTHLPAVVETIRIFERGPDGKPVNLLG
jgi:type IV secretory pathway TraG/TraD family ATPase VirD4